jgi:hypothetical protein
MYRQAVAAVAAVADELSYAGDVTTRPPREYAATMPPRADAAYATEHIRRPNAGDHPIVSLTTPSNSLSALSFSATVRATPQVLPPQHLERARARLGVQHTQARRRHRVDVVRR